MGGGHWGTERIRRMVVDVLFVSVAAAQRADVVIGGLEESKYGGWAAIG